MTNIRNGSRNRNESNGESVISGVISWRRRNGGNGQQPSGISWLAISQP
jgi:hypothetical protein